MRYRIDDDSTAMESVHEVEWIIREGERACAEARRVPEVRIFGQKIHGIVQSGQEPESCVRAMPIVVRRGVRDLDLSR